MILDQARGDNFRENFMGLDKLDRQIMSILQKDGRKPFTEIARATGVAEGTVRNRVARLQANQTLQILGMVDPYQVGYDAPAVIGVSVHAQTLEDAAQAIAALPEVSYLIMVSGGYDLMVEVLCRDREHLARFIRDDLRQIPGIQRTEAYFILHTYKLAQGAVPVAVRPNMPDQ
jgi:Lrp/AsnC family transcriptional regulator for asnA, asnC and gidA